VNGAVPHSAIAIRDAETTDVPQLIALMAAHAEFEQADFDPAGLDQRLIDTLISDSARASCLVAAHGGPTGGVLVGYATVMPEYSTWAGSEFLHMDTLFVDEAYRGHGLGARLMTAVIGRAEHLGLTEVQWQTPEWNRDAVRFYERLGARGTTKIRFHQRVGP
jgi:GNAT superfamily N-acetyltransferase